MAKKRRPKVQAGEVTYELHSLGWKAFQNLCVTITEELWGQTVQSFFDSHDGGRDGAFSGIWKPTQTETLEGTFTVQCKFTSKAGKQIHLGDLKDELIKAKRLAERGLADNYFLFTNARLTGTSDEEISTAFRSEASVKQFRAFGVDRISQIIRESSRLRMLVPRVYGLGDLSQILDQRAYDQAREILSALGDDLAKFVITDAYRRSAKALTEHGFVLLLGEPACGKSIIAAALAVGSLDQWGCSTIKVRDAEDFVEHSNPHEEKQFFWVDDAFGATQLDWSLATGWNRVFPHIQAAIRRGAKVLFTSRDYIYRSARNHLKESALPLIQESQVVIQVEKLSKDEREQILYNHIRRGGQTSEFKSKVKTLLPDVAIHSHFSPEIARRLGDPIFTKRLSLSKTSLDEFVSHPVELLCEVVRTLDTGGRSALALVFMRGGSLPSPMKLSPDEEQAINLLGGSLSDVRVALNALNGSLLLESRKEGVDSWRYKHPTIRDAFALVIAEDRELMDIYLTGAPLEKLFQEVTCGDVAIPGVKIVVTLDRYDSLLQRMELSGQATYNYQRAEHLFLAHRCAPDFLLRYIERHPTFISSLKACSTLRFVSDVNVLARLNEVGLLPEEKRIAVVGTLRELAVETPDSGFLEESIRQMLGDEELADILYDVRSNLLPELGITIQKQHGDYQPNDEPEMHFYTLRESLRDYAREFVEFPEACLQIKAGLDRIDEIIEELKSQSENGSSDEFVEHGSSGHSFDEDRSVFDDVDE